MASTTAQDVFDLAIALCDQMSDTGETDFEYDQDLKCRALGIINVLRHECMRASEEYLERQESGKRVETAMVTSWTDVIDGVDDAVAQGAMPYGLAAQLMIDEDPDIASYCAQKYEERLADFTMHLPQSFEPIAYVYGRPDEYGYGSRW